MFFSIVISSLFIIFLLAEFWSFKKLKKKCEDKKRKVFQECFNLEKVQKALKEKADFLESNLSERFLLYDLTRRIAPVLNRKDLLSAFDEETKHLGKSEYMPYFLKLRELCLERIKIYNELQELSIHDSLTKVYNRRHFIFRYESEFGRAAKFKLSLAFLMIDIDHFKKINDTYGHLVGDAVLREVAKIIRENLREIDFLARFGGEEFSVILPETDKASAIMAAERINTKVSQQNLRVFDEDLRVTISVGVATFPQNAFHSDVLIEVADKALYKAKLSGRNRVCWF